MSWNPPTTQPIDMPPPTDLLWEQFMQSNDMAAIEGEALRIENEEDEHKLGLMLAMSVSEVRELLSTFMTMITERDDAAFRMLMGFLGGIIASFHTMLHEYEDARDAGAFDEDGEGVIDVEFEVRPNDAD